jgi:hypothetical protein
MGEIKIAYRILVGRVLEKMGNIYEDRTSNKIMPQKCYIG